MGEDKLIIAGFGGQGVLLLGDLIAYTALKEGKNVSWVPSYGPESRGGTCNCQVIYLKKEIGSPVVDEPNIVIAFTQPSIEKFIKRIKPSGTLIYDSSLIKEKPERKDINVVEVPATEMNKKAANMIMLGAYIQITQKISLETVIKKSLPEKLTEDKAKYVPANIEALKRGMDYVRKKYQTK